MSLSSFSSSTPTLCVRVSVWRGPVNWSKSGCEGKKGWWAGFSISIPLPTNVLRTQPVESIDDGLIYRDRILMCEKKARHHSRLQTFWNRRTDGQLLPCKDASQQTRKTYISLIMSIVTMSFLWCSFFPEYSDDTRWFHPIGMYACMHTWSKFPVYRLAATMAENSLEWMRVPRWRVRMHVSTKTTCGIWKTKLVCLVYMW